MKGKLSKFLMEHRFKIWDLVDPKELTKQDFEISRNFNGIDFLWLSQKKEELSRLTAALILADHMAGYETNQADLFSKLVSYLRDDEWKFALKFCPYYKVDVALKNLEVIQVAMDEACIGISSAKAGMETAATQGKRGNISYEREQSKATAQLLNFSALYASYVDVCWRIRDYCKLKKSKAYSNAIYRLTSKNSGAHSFFKDFRNFMLHYHIQAPGITIIHAEHRSSVIELNSADMLYSGFDWKPLTKEFLQSQEKINILESASDVIKDVGNVVKFINYIVNKKLSDESRAYSYYLLERRKNNHLSKALIDVNSIFGLKSSLLDRLSSRKFAIEMSATSLSNEELKNLIVSHANRYANLPQEILEKVSIEAEKIISNRKVYPTGGSYFDLKKVE